MNLTPRIPEEGQSTVEKAKTPLFLTAIGMDVDEIKPKVEAMHGAFRIPALLKKLDQLTRI